MRKAHFVMIGDFGFNFIGIESLRQILVRQKRL
jgi:hypothetical protein